MRRATTQGLITIVPFSAQRQSAVLFLKPHLKPFKEAEFKLNMVRVIVDRPCRLSTGGSGGGDGAHGTVPAARDAAAGLRRTVGAPRLEIDTCCPPCHRYEF